MSYFELLPIELIPEILNYIYSYNDLDILSNFSYFTKILYNEFYWINRSYIFLLGIDKKLIKNYLSFNKDNLNVVICNYINMINTYNNMIYLIDLYILNNIRLKFGVRCISNIEILFLESNKSDELILSQLYIENMKISSYIVVDNNSKKLSYYKNPTNKILERNVSVNNIYNLLFHVLLNSGQLDFDL